MGGSPYVHFYRGSPSTQTPQLAAPRASGIAHRQSGIAAWCRGAQRNKELILWAGSVVIEQGKMVSSSEGTFKVRYTKNLFYTEGGEALEQAA